MTTIDLDHPKYNPDHPENEQRPELTVAFVRAAMRAADALRLKVEFEDRDDRVLRLDWEFSEDTLEPLYAGYEITDFLISQMEQVIYDDLIPMLIDGDKNSTDSSMSAIDGIIKQGHGERTLVIYTGTRAASCYKFRKNSTEFTLWGGLRLETKPFGEDKTVDTSKSTS